MGTLRNPSTMRETDFSSLSTRLSYWFDRGQNRCTSISLHPVIFGIA
jgi:hypothetical protein